MNLIISLFRPAISEEPLTSAIGPPAGLVLRPSLIDSKVNILLVKFSEILVANLMPTHVIEIHTSNSWNLVVSSENQLISMNISVATTKSYANQHKSLSGTSHANPIDRVILSAQIQLGESIEFQLETT